MCPAMRAVCPRVDGSMLSRIYLALDNFCGYSTRTKPKIILTLILPFLF